MKKTFFILIILSLALSACATQTNSALRMAPLDQMPAYVKSSPVVVQEAYQFAAANPNVMKHIPCYCGCGDMGHTSNYSCYVSHADDKGKLTFDNHAIGCSICVDITQDAMRLAREGKTVPEIKAYIDATYSKYGTSNMP
jgi:hypothetical protein